MQVQNSGVADYSQSAATEDRAVRQPLTDLPQTATEDRVVRQSLTDLPKTATQDRTVAQALEKLSQNAATQDRAGRFDLKDIPQFPEGRKHGSHGLPDDDGNPIIMIPPLYPRGAA